ncbi:cell division ATP-binding protein FtsE [Ferrimonas aestuarii]|uniref:Cell division ATP-binding protein FtsE n=1 Tax=Ferrimonas aestuarii TaxID=2569539 RepID=A0A4U1BP32_9GAMM|nr:cell division ATP-binding protein FtsE [Ferrimonas aestuarii]TKB55048.1 cell division ATP-binding protein FtsE [Ferrimonas aestuarii]
MIRFEQVSKVYPGGFRALNQVNFSIGRGEMAFLTGPSGAGKSTLLKLVTAIETPSTGKVMVDGQDIATLSRSKVPYLRRKIGIIFQDHNLLMDKSVRDNVALPLLIEGFSSKEIEKRVEAALDLVGLSDKIKFQPQHLSGGEQQRVGIARAIVTKPKLLLADEPTGNLDPSLSVEIMRLFETFNRAGTSVLIATHDLGLIARMRYRTLTLKDGSMISEAYQGPAS